MVIYFLWFPCIVFQESALEAAADWINKNQSISVGFKLKTFDGGIDEQSCAIIAQVFFWNLALTRKSQKKPLIWYLQGFTSFKHKILIDAVRIVQR